MRHDLHCGPGLSCQNAFRYVLACVLIALAGMAEPARAADAPAGGKPATVAEAAKVIDLSTIPLVPGAEVQGRRRMARITYNVESTAAKAFDFHKQKLIAAKWKELPGSFSSDQSSSATFARDGYHLSLSVYDAGKAGTAMVSLINHGNVDVKKLPVPKDVKSLYAGPVSTSCISAEPVEKTAAAIHKLLTAQGWQPYGKAGDQQFYKQNAVLLSARTLSAPAQGGKTVIDYSTELMSADIPAPTETLSLQYSDVTAQVLFDTSADSDEIFAFYRKVLPAAGWEATTEKPFKSGFKQSMIFRNPAKDMMMLQTYTVDDKLRVTVQYQTAAEIDEIEKELEARAEKQKKEKEAKAKNKPANQVAIKLPAGAKDVKRDKDKIEFTVAAGKGKAVAEDLRKQLGKAGWKEDLATLEDVGGTISFSRDGKDISVLYIDTGIMPAEITVSGLGVEIVEAKAKD